MDDKYCWLLREFANLIILESLFYNEIRSIYTLEDKDCWLLREFVNLLILESPFYNEIQNIYTGRQRFLAAKRIC